MEQSRQVVESAKEPLIDNTNQDDRLRLPHQGRKTRSGHPAISFLKNNATKLLKKSSVPYSDKQSQSRTP
jgi:hypothetical protein